METGAAGGFACRLHGGQDQRHGNADRGWSGRRDDANLHMITVASGLQRGDHFFADATEVLHHGVGDFGIVGGIAGHFAAHLGQKSGAAEFHHLADQAFQVAG